MAAARQTSAPRRAPAQSRSAPKMAAAGQTPAPKVATLESFTGAIAFALCRARAFRGHRIGREAAAESTP